MDEPFDYEQAKRQAREIRRREPRQVTVHINAQRSRFSREEIEDIIRAINEAPPDGHR